MDACPLCLSLSLFNYAFQRNQSLKTFTEAFRMRRERVLLHHDFSIRVEGKCKIAERSRCSVRDEHRFTDSDDTDVCNNRNEDSVGLPGAKTNADATKCSSQCILWVTQQHAVPTARLALGKASKEAQGGSHYLEERLRSGNKEF